MTALKIRAEPETASAVNILDFIRIPKLQEENQIRFLECIDKEESYTSESARMIFQSSRARPGGVTAERVICVRPSVFTNVDVFSV